MSFSKYTGYFDTYYNCIFYLLGILVGEVENVLKNMPADKFQQQYGRPKPGLDFPLVFSCKLGGRSAKALQIAEKLGYTK